MVQGEGLPMASIPTASPLAEVQVLRKSSAGVQHGPGGGQQHEQQQQQPPRPGEAVPLDGRGAGFRAQAFALYRKNAVFQRRNWCSNVCLLSAPIFFCLMLFGIQIAINKLLLTGDDYACGCKCTQCCYKGDRSNCTAVAMGTCPYDCLERSKTQCGIQYSNARQSFFCAIPHPSSWPAVLQVPARENRAVPWRPDPVLLYTGADEASAAQLSSNLLPPPAATAANLLAVRNYLNAWNQTSGGAGASVPGELLTMMGLTLGTNAGIFAGLYVETALMREQLYALWPAGTCESLGFAGRLNITLDTMVSAMVNASNSPAAARVLNQQLRGLLASAGGGGAAAGGGGSGSDAAVTMVTNLALNCTDMPAAFLKTADDISRKLYCGYYQSRCDGTTGAQQVTAAYDWKATDANRFEPDIYYNDTYGLPNSASPTTYQRIPQVINMAVNAWLRTFVGANTTANLVGVQETPKAASEIRLDFSSLLGPLFFTWVVQMLLPIFLMQLVYEKEKRLRMMMKMHGLGDTAYWLVTYGWFYGLYVVYMAIFIIFGSIIKLNMFIKNHLGVQLILYAIFGHNMIAFAFLLSCFFSSSKTATVFAYLIVFGTGLIGSLLLSRLIGGNLWYMTLIELVPSFALYRGLFELGEYSFIAVYRNAYGMRFTNLSDPGNGLITVYIILALEWWVFMALAWYLEQVFASGTGNRRHPLFFLDRFRKGHKAAADARLNAKAQEVAPASDEADDVAAEHARVDSLTDYIGNPIIVKELKKIYPGMDGQPPKLAVRRLNLAIEKGECFGLLGPNGAGKSTSINMMIGLLEPTHGTAVIGGYDIRRDMGAIYSLMGVCPQHDLLWETLTGREHLLFYGRLKGLKGAALQEAVESGLRSVNLWNGGVGDKQAAQYSGGMKRRLSVAISFVGDPVVVYLDEPSTGLDPASRRNLWDVVKGNKAGRGIVLTTHSMEEAETLCDRLGIFVDGQLVCIGNPKEITSRYGGYLVMTLTVAAGQDARAREFVRRLSPNARLTYSVGGTLKFELPSNEVTLSGVFSAMAAAKDDPGPDRLQVLDWGVANATLEEVFIKFARAIGAKAGE